MNDDDLLQDPFGLPPEQWDRNPTAEERADFVVRRLAQFIRDGRTIDGMPFQQWRDMAETEIANAVAGAEEAIRDDDAVGRRLLFVFAAALVTVGFWGTLAAYDRVPYLLAALFSGAAGVVLLAAAAEWRFRKLWKRHRRRERVRTLASVEDLNRKIRRMERELKDEARGLEKALKAVSRSRRREGERRH